MTTAPQAVDGGPPPLRVPRLVSIVIPCRNGGPFIGDQLDSIEQQRRSRPDIPLEVVVVDNGSTDDTVAVIRSRMVDRPHLRLVDGPYATNVSQVRNIGTAASCGDYVIWLDADDMVQKGWLGAMFDAACRYDAIGGTVDEDALNSGPSRHWRTTLLTPAGLPKPFGLLFAPIGCNCGASREAWERVGGFDDSWGYGGEEVDFFWRVQLAGMSLGFVPDAVVSYRYRTTLKGVWRQGVAYGEGNARLAAQHPELDIAVLEPGFVRTVAGLLGLGVRSAWSERARGQFAFYGGHLWGQCKGSVEHRRLHLG